MLPTVECWLQFVDSPVQDTVRQLEDTARKQDIVREQYTAQQQGTVQEQDTVQQQDTVRGSSADLEEHRMLVGVRCHRQNRNSIIDSVRCSGPTPPFLLREKAGKN